MEVTLLDHRFLRCKPSLIAAIGMFTARRMLDGDWVCCLSDSCSLESWLTAFEKCGLVTERRFRLLLKLHRDTITTRCTITCRADGCSGVRQAICVQKVHQQEVPSSIYFRSRLGTNTRGRRWLVPVCPSSSQSKSPNIIRSSRASHLLNLLCPPFKSSASSPRGKPRSSTSLHSPIFISLSSHCSGTVPSVHSFFPVYYISPWCGSL